MLSVEQGADSMLSKCFASVVSADKAKAEKVAYILDNKILMRKWCSVVQPNADWSSIYQVVIPSAYRQHVLSAAHESQWSGHLGVSKTYQLVLRHFFWPGLNSDVTKYCRSCHVCQVAGKPNQTVRTA